MNKYLVAVIIIALLAINIFTLLRYRSLERTQLVTTNSGAVDMLNALKSDFVTGILNSDFELQNFFVKDSVDNIMSIKDIFENGQTHVVICRFSRAHCESCVDSAIKLLKASSEMIGAENIIFLADHPKNRVFRTSIPLYGLQGSKVYNCAPYGIPAEEAGFPYFFILDRDLKVSNVFIPDKGEPALTRLYLDKIQKRFYSE